MPISSSTALSAQRRDQLNALLATRAHRVTDKTSPPPSGDPHDFHTIGRYCWPNPDSADGLPYRRIDCQVNEESYGDRYDLQRYKDFIEAVVTLATHATHTGAPELAADAVRRLQVWFLDPATRMNPQLTYAAALPGVYDGIWFGIIQGAQLTRIPPAIRLLQTTGSLDPATEQGLRSWFGEFGDWLHHSPYGIEHERSEKCNNTWLWFYTLRAAVAEFGDRPDRIGPALDRVVAGMERQIAPDGSLPEELRRERGLEYSLFCLGAMVTAADIAGRHDRDLWSLRTAQGGSFRACFDYLAPLLVDPAADQSAVAGELDQAIWLFRRAARVYAAADYLAVSDSVRARSASPAADRFGPDYDLFADA